jgi:hypothetical protein
MNMNGTIVYTEGEFLGVGNLRRYDGLDGALYYVGSNNDLERLYNAFEKQSQTVYGTVVPRYDVHPLMNINRSYGLEIRDGKFAIVTAENLVDRILKW